MTPTQYLWTAWYLSAGISHRRLAELYRESPDIEPEDLIDAVNQKFTRSSNHLLPSINMEDLESLGNSAQQLINRHTEKGIDVVDIADSRYPAVLRTIANPPIVLYCKGSLDALENDATVAVVGTRHPTTIGLAVADKVAAGFVERGFAIIEGLALGIDTAAHRSAILHNGTTVAVLAGSLDSIYPKENRKLAEEIIDNRGVLVSEHPIGGTLHRGSFVQRDRIQSGLSLGVCAVQTDLHGGAMHTVRFANEQHRLIFCPAIQEDPALSVYRGITSIFTRYHAYLLKGQSDYEVLDRLMRAQRRELYDPDGVMAFSEISEH